MDSNVNLELVTWLMVYILGDKYELIKVEVNGTWKIIQTEPFKEERK